jgi:serine/threonine protein kinase
VRASELPTAVPPGTRATLRLPDALVLGRYRLLRRLGAGAFATVWEARDEHLQRDVALKVMVPERIVGGRFEREARAAARLAHPGIVTLYEAAIDADGAYLVTELVRGATVDQLLDEGRLSDRDCVLLAIALCDALAHAHANGVVHRDVKPSNILVPERPVTPAHAAKLTDFGVASVIGGNALTRAGDVLGTLAYMAPEQAEGLPVGPSADVYSLALVVYEALSGVNPVGARTPAQQARRLGAYLPPLRRQRRDLPTELGQGVDQALRPRPRERGTIEELQEALEVALPHLADRPGVVTGAWRSAGHSSLSTEDARASPLRVPGLVGSSVSRSSAPARFAPPPPASGPEPQGAQEHEHPAPEEPASPRRRLALLAPAAPAPGWRARAPAAGAAAAAAAMLCAYVIHPAPAPPALMALVAGAAVAVAPRLGWLLLALVSSALVAIGGLPGEALVVLLGALLPVVLLSGRCTLWPVPAGALLLGIVGLGGGWPALASRAGSAWRRASLGATGLLWLVIAGELRGDGLYARALPGAPDRSVWGSSLSGAVHNVIAGPSTPRVLLTAAVWACAAALLPAMRSTRSVVVDAALALIWCAALAAVTASVLGPTHGPSSLIPSRELLLGALASAVIAVALRAASGWRIARRPVNGPVA